MFGDFDILGSKHFSGSSPQGQVSSKIQLESRFPTTLVQLVEHNCCFCPKNCVCIFAKVCFWSLFSSRLALGSPSCLSSACPRYLIKHPGWKVVMKAYMTPTSYWPINHWWLIGQTQPTQNPPNVTEMLLDILCANVPVSSISHLRSDLRSNPIQDPRLDLESNMKSNPRYNLKSNLNYKPRSDTRSEHFKIKGYLDILDI